MAYSGIQIWTSNRGQITDGFERKTGTPVILGESRELSGTVVLARKHDMPYRMCLVYLKHDQLTKKDAIPLPRMDDVLEALGEDQWFF